MESTTTSTLDKFGEEDIFSTVLRYGLYVGAIFQLICIGSSIFLPISQETQGNDGEIGEEQKQSTDIINAARRQHKIRKLEKKKRR
ncbi:protein anon-73B1 [Episyrphus balteatus]|uniref:protein anon-73B1 n=1 Tax=Episyrphus balteatus TaxID=286459 RepID=UPI0024868066|nr:protein anon-73B1 [Episyrphus balteatus]